MRMKMWNRWLVSGATALGTIAMAGVVAAAPTTEESGSIIVFPKVIGTSERDTLIQISNTGNATVHARCFYVNAGIPGRWIETDFEIWLTKQQPTQWMARSGRSVNIFAPFGSPGAGFDPGLIPPVPLGFQGELRCVQVDESGAPLRANKLKGTATLITNATSDASKYNAIAIPGNPDAGVGNNDNNLLFDNTPSHAGEYDACPDTLTINTFSTLAGINDPILEDLGDCSTLAGCPITTFLTLVPCGQDLERLVGGRSRISIETFDEFETVRSTSITVDCWLNASIDDPIFSGVFRRDSLAVHARFNPIAGDGGVIGVGEERRIDDGSTTWAAFNLHIEGNRFDAARNVTGVLLPGRTCQGGSNQGAVCTDTAQCLGGTCVNGVLDRMVLPGLQ